MGLSGEEILAEIQKLQEEAKAIEDQVIELAWYSKGTITLDNLWAMSPKRRSNLTKKLKKFYKPNKTSSNQ